TTHLYSYFLHSTRSTRDLRSFPTRRSSDLQAWMRKCSMPRCSGVSSTCQWSLPRCTMGSACHSSSAVMRHSTSAHDCGRGKAGRSEEHTSELQSRENLVCRLLLEKKKITKY